MSRSPLPQQQQAIPRVQQGELMRQTQQQGVQLQSLDGRRQSQRQVRRAGGGERAAVAAAETAAGRVDRAPETELLNRTGPMAGGEPQGIAYPAGVARSEPEPFAPGSQPNSHQEPVENEAARRSQAILQTDSPLGRDAGSASHL